MAKESPEVSSIRIQVTYLFTQLREILERKESWKNCSPTLNPNKKKETETW